MSMVNGSPQYATANAFRRALEDRLKQEARLKAVPISRALQSESTRRQMQLPLAMVSPAPNWPEGYRAYARKTRIDGALHNMETALEYVGSCLNPLLSGSRDTGRWLPGSGWSDRRPAGTPQ